MKQKFKIDKKKSIMAAPGYHSNQSDLKSGTNIVANKSQEPFDIFIWNFH